jgi:hypothetical protein
MMNKNIGSSDSDFQEIDHSFDVNKKFFLVI